MKRVHVVVAMLAHAGVANGADADWPRYGGDDAKTRHSALTQINRGNVGQLTLAWQYDTGEKGDTQTQPIVVGRTLYGYTPSHKTFALDATHRPASCGRSIPASRASAPTAASCTGKTAKMRACSRRSTTSSTRWMPLTGKPVTGFGKAGRIDSARRPGPRCGVAIGAAHDSRRDLP